MLLLAWVLDGSFYKQCKPNKLINWLISQQMHLGIINLRLMNMCCATKRIAATKISNRKMKFYLLSDGFIYQKSPRWIFLTGARDVVWYHCMYFNAIRDDGRTIFKILIIDWTRIRGGSEPDSGRRSGIGPVVIGPKTQPPIKTPINEATWEERPGVRLLCGNS